MNPRNVGVVVRKADYNRWGPREILLTTVFTFPAKPRKRRRLANGARVEFHPSQLVDHRHLYVEINGTLDWNGQQFGFRCSDSMESDAFSPSGEWCLPYLATLR